MTHIVISMVSWYSCFNHAHKQSLDESNIRYSPTKTRQFLSDQYSIVQWSVLRDIDKVKVTFADDKKIPWFLLRWE